ncbi:MAG TPA: hypothetical protein VGX28_00795 [Frankiaceae bacterium]|nr:hypothetical protein [Frankiaceae bacterium]
MIRTLRLHKDTLAELTSDDLATVVGGVTLTGYYPTLPVTDCFTNTIVTSEAVR